MMRQVLQIWALFVSMSICFSQEEYDDAMYFENCELERHYGDTSPMIWTRDEIQEWLASNHRQIVNDTYSAVADLEGGVDGDGAISISSLLFGDAALTENWEPASVWPIGNTSHPTILQNAVDWAPFWNDLHLLFPMDPSVKQQLSGLWWGVCGTVQDVQECIIPAFDTSAMDTARDPQIVIPSMAHRGKVARALLYAVLRYEATLNLKLTDCRTNPRNNPTTTFGFLSELLVWHESNPVSEEELTRNQNICTKYQGNRNILVDYPQLASQFFGAPDSNVQIKDTSGHAVYSTCEVTVKNDCQDLPAGAVGVAQFDIEPEVVVVFVPFYRIPQSIGSLYMTNLPWDGSRFLATNESRPGEGILEYQLRTRNLEKAQYFGYNVEFPQDTGSWRNVSTGNNARFNLDTSGDAFFLYCMDRENQPHFLNGISYSGSWSEPFLPTYGAGESSLPFELKSAGSVLLPMPRTTYLYAGEPNGTLSELVAAFSNPRNFLGSDVPLVVNPNVNIDPVPTPAPTTMAPTIATTPSPSLSSTTITDSPTPFNISAGAKSAYLTISVFLSVLFGLVLMGVQYNIA